MESSHKKFRNLPDCTQGLPQKSFKYLAPSIGFGLDPLSNDYKLIYMRNYTDLHTDVLGRHYAIYKMSTDSWRVLKEEEVPFSVYLVIRPNISNACVNGVYYWLAHRRPRPGFFDHKVVVFHLGSEVFQLIESPLSESSRIGHLLLLHDRISVCDTDRRRKRSNDIWVLNDDGQWTKVLKIELPILQVENMFGFWRDSKVLLQYFSGELLVYDLKSQEFKEFGIQSKKAGYYLQVFTYEESLSTINNKVS
ncbi:hypothetical protein PTKIN_Ptkin16aG0531000 [Pterospermum kingtungense]